MIEFKTAKCPKCGKIAEIIFSNNPLVPGICNRCICNELDGGNLEQADFFCRTYNLPFRPERWIELQERCGEGVFKQYTKEFFETDSNNLYRQDVTPDWWKRINEEWANCRTYEEVLAKIEPIKQSFIARSQIKWGPNYTFEEYVQLDSLLISTLRAGDISNPLRIDAIKKACKISVELDKAIYAGDSKGIKELSSSYSSFTKSAQLDEIIASDNNDVISTVAELADYIEKCGGQYTYYDGVQRDIVDKTIADIKEYIRVLVQDATGLSATLENIAENYKRSVATAADEESFAAVSLEELMKQNEGDNEVLDAELAAESLDEDFMGAEDGDEYF